MKSLVRWSTTLSLVGGILLGSLLGGANRALALTQEQVVERLQSVPVFMITNAQGVPLVAVLGDEEAAPAVAGVFISRQDAQTSLDNLRQSDPELATDVQVVPVSLAQVYQLAVANENQEQPLEFTFVPTTEQVESARSVLEQSGENPDEFDGVPIFLARSTADEGGYLTIQQGQNQVVPMFFNQDELQNLLAQLRQSQPELADSMTIQVVNLESLIQTLQDSDNPELNQILLVPPRETIEFIRSLQGQPGQGQPAQGQPARPQ
jgi:DNA-binding TFAR19-related protein (PDSD5 family)